MALLSGLLVLGLVCAFSVCVGAAAGLDPALLPLPGIAAAAVALTVAGCLSLLQPGLWLVLGVGLLAAVYCGVRAGGRAVRQALRSPALLLFGAAALFFWVLFAVRQPMFTQWDEFTAWGAAAKLVKVKDALYVAQPYSLQAYHSFPGSSMVCYLFQAFSPAFSEWACLAALDTLAMACAAAAAAITAPSARWPYSVLVLGAAVLLPVLFNVLPAGAVSMVYQNAMADIPLGLVFGGALCLYYAAPRRCLGLALAAAPLALLALFKDIAFAYGLIAAFVMALDILLCAPQRRGVLRALGQAAAGFVLAALPALAGFLGWNRYTALADPATGAGGAVGGAGLSYGAVLLGGVRQLLGLGREEKFSQLLALMAQAFWQRRVFLAGSGLAVAALAAALALLAWRGGASLRPLVACGGLALCFAALYAFHLILYHYNFAELEALALKDYERYLSPYYTGWLLVLLCLLGQGAAQKPHTRLAPLALGGTALAALLLVAWRGVPVAGFWSETSSLYTVRQDVQRRAAVMNETLDWPNRVLVLSQGDDATRWYYYKYELTATVVDGWWDDADGTRKQGDFMNLVAPGESSGYLYSTPGTFAELRAWMEKQDCDYLLIDRSDGYLAAELGPATAGGLSDTAPPTLYRFTPDASPCLVPVAAVESEVAP